MTKILLTGSNGLLGQKIVNLLSEKPDIALIITSKGENRISETPKNATFESLDITNELGVKRIFGKYQPQAVIHTAALTNVDECELNPEACYLQNVVATENIAEACKAQNSFLVHLSTDFIFDGKTGMYDENAVPNPISIYGESKLKAEQIIVQTLDNYAIARTVLVYGITPKMSRTNIILWVKKSLEEGKNIKVVDDQWRTPTLAEDLAMGCYLLAEKQITGIFNISGKELLTPYEMAIKTADFFSLDKTLIEKADASSFTQPAQRPPRTGFNIEKAEKILGYQPHSFHQGLELLAKQIKDNL
jgi:dTDP-4-dehydrorhamnose reductase